MANKVLFLVDIIFKFLAFEGCDVLKFGTAPAVLMERLLRDNLIPGLNLTQYRIVVFCFGYFDLECDISPNYVVSRVHALQKWFNRRGVKFIAISPIVAKTSKDQTWLLANKMEEKLGRNACLKLTKHFASKKHKNLKFFLPETDYLHFNPQGRQHVLKFFQGSVKRWIDWETATWTPTKTFDAVDLTDAARKRFVNSRNQRISSFFTSPNFAVHDRTLNETFTSQELLFQVRLANRFFWSSDVTRVRESPTPFAARERLCAPEYEAYKRQKTFRWGEIDIMQDALAQRFEQHPEHMQILCETKGFYLVSDGPDPRWDRCLATKSGLNLLGIMMANLRDDVLGRQRRQEAALPETTK